MQLIWTMGSKCDHLHDTLGVTEGRGGQSRISIEVHMVIVNVVVRRMLECLGQKRQNLDLLVDFI